MLEEVGCAGMVDVFSPPGWWIQRSGKLEPRHVDFMFPVTGAINLQTENQNLEALPGELLVVPSWHDRIVSIDVPCHHICVNFFNLAQMSAVNQVSIRSTGNTEAIAFYTKTLLEEHSALPNEAIYRSHLADCLAILLSRELNSSIQQGTSAKAEKVIQLLRNTDAKQLSVKEIARKTGMSISTFRTFCLKNLGQAPLDLLDDIRMDRARKLLRYTDFSIDDIAIQLGYADRFTFSKAFVRLNQVPPATYRKRQASTSIRIF